MGAVGDPLGCDWTIPARPTPKRKAADAGTSTGAKVPKQRVSPDEGSPESQVSRYADHKLHCHGVDLRAVSATLAFQKKPVGERLQLALTAKEAEDQAAAEALPLIRLPGSTTGYKGVGLEPGSRQPRVGVALPYFARLWVPEEGTKLELGKYATAEEAALVYARCLGRSRALAVVDQISGLTAAQSDPPLTRADVLRMAAEEGLELITAAKTASGYKGVVVQRNGWFGAQEACCETRTTKWLGNFRLKEEAALAYLTSSEPFSPLIPSCQSVQIALSLARCS